MPEKRLTGGDRLKARRMREDFWSFTPSHTFVLLTNHKPIVTGADEGIWRRLQLVPWEVVIPGAERDEELPGKLAAEHHAILTWLIDGYRDWRAHGFGEPDQVTAATAAYRAESDALGRFLAQRCISGRHYTTRSSELFASWSQWCSAEGEEPGTQTAFSLALTNRGFDKKPTAAGNMWKGLGIISE